MLRAPSLGLQGKIDAKLHFNSCSQSHSKLCHFSQNQSLGISTPIQTQIAASDRDSQLEDLKEDLHGEWLIVTSKRWVNKGCRHQSQNNREGE